MVLLAPEIKKLLMRTLCSYIFSSGSSVVSIVFPLLGNSRTAEMVHFEGPHFRTLRVDTTTEWKSASIKQLHKSTRDVVVWCRYSISLRWNPNNLIISKLCNQEICKLFTVIITVAKIVSSYQMLKQGIVRAPLCNQIIHQNRNITFRTSVRHRIRDYYH